MSSYSDLNDGCEAAVKRLRDLAGKLASPDLDADAAKALNFEVQRVQSEAEQSLRGMEREVKGAGPAKRRVMSEQVAALRQQLAEQRGALTRANDARARASLIRPDRAKQMHEAASDKLEAAASRSAANTQKLRDVQSMVEDTTGIGVGCARLWAAMPLLPPRVFL